VIRKIEYTSIDITPRLRSEFFPLIFSARRAILDRLESAYGGRNVNPSPNDVSLNEITATLRPLHDMSLG
jgi:hypothetical protein